MLYRFADCELDTGSHELTVGGVARDIEPQVFDLLELLVSRAGELVTHDELVEHVWQGRIVSDSAISARISAARAALGDDGTRQRYIKTVPRRGFRFVGELVAQPGGESAPRREAAQQQHVRFCTSADGTRIAYAQSGEGRPLLRAGHWLTHLEHDWTSPVWRPLLDELGRHFLLTRYDQRSNGLSDRQARPLDLDAFVADLEAVADAAELERFVLYGTSQGAPMAVAYAARHPERVSHLILHGGYVQGRLVRGDEEERERGMALLTLIRHGWGQAGSPFLRAFATLFMPDGTREQIGSLAEQQRVSATPEDAASIREAVDHFDVTGLLPRVSVPTLVLHARDDGVHPLDQARALAAGIPGAEFAMLDSANHVLPEHDPAWPVMFERILDFVDS